MQTQFNICGIYRKINDLERITPFLTSPPQPAAILALPKPYNKTTSSSTSCSTGINLPLPTDEFLAQINGNAESKKIVLISYPQIFDWYPELKALAEILLDIGNIKSVQDAFIQGKVGSDVGIETSGQERDEWQFAQDLLKTEPERGKRLLSLLASGRLHKAFTQLTDKCNSLGYDLLTDESCKKLEDEKPELAQEVHDLGKATIEITEFLISEFPPSSYSDDFGIRRSGTRINHIAYGAEVGTLLGYSKEDIMVYLFANNLPEGVCSEKKGSRFKLNDRQFVEDFYRNVERWKEQKVT